MLLLDMEYDEMSQTVQTTQYCWIREGRYYHFVHREDGTVVRASGLIFAYDTDEGMFGINENGRVVCVNSDGSVNSSFLRQMVILAGGHLSLCNHDHHIEHIIDVYGNILNV